jgi:hypothetical protein
MGAKPPFTGRQPSLAKCGMKALSQRQNLPDIPLNQRGGDVKALIERFSVRESRISPVIDRLSALIYEPNALLRGEDGLDAPRHVADSGAVEPV